MNKNHIKCCNSFRIKWYSESCKIKYNKIKSSTKIVRQTKIQLANITK